jgi:hypothetical protein
MVILLAPKHLPMYSFLVMFKIFISLARGYHEGRYCGCHSASFSAFKISSWARCIAHVVKLLYSMHLVSVPNTGEKKWVLGGELRAVFYM